jgi:pyruvate/2-oxoglutarate dehydrogenase complex dihydrolipoamide acyltransferase (E2) component
MGEFCATCADASSLAGVLHGQRVSSTAASETAWPLPSSGDPNRPVTSHATGKAGEGQWQAFAGERLEAAAAAAAARRAAERRGHDDHKSRSEATGVVGDDDSSNNSSNASEGGQSGSTSAGPSVQTAAAAAAAPQPARQVVSSPSKAAGGDKTGGWSSVRESMGRARAAFTKEEPPSPSQEAEKRRKLRAGDI